MKRLTLALISTTAMFAAIGAGPASAHCHKGHLSALSSRELVEYENIAKQYNALSGKNENAATIAPIVDQFECVSSMSDGRIPEHLGNIRSDPDQTLVCRSAREDQTVDLHGGRGLPQDLYERILAKRRLAQQKDQESCDANMRLYVAQRHEYAKLIAAEIVKYQAEMERQRQAAEKQEAEREAAEKIEAEEARKPINRLWQAYTLYVLVKYCHDIREGYLIQYVNDVEMQRAEKAIRAIVAKVRSEEPSINTNKSWALAQEGANNQPISQSYCERLYYQPLMDMSPIDPYDIHKPE